MGINSTKELKDKVIKIIILKISNYHIKQLKKIFTEINTFPIKEYIFEKKCILNDLINEDYQ